MDDMKEDLQKQIADYSKLAETGQSEVNVFYKFDVFLTLQFVLL